jgi:histidine ammonia-lyase
MATQWSEVGLKEPVVLDGSSLCIEDVIRAARGTAQIQVSPGALERVCVSREWIDAISEADNVTVYGVNTGFGSLAEVRIGRDAVAKLARNLILPSCATACAGARLHLSWGLNDGTYTVAGRCLR